MEQTWELKPKIEALLVAINRPVAIQALARCLEVSEEEVDAALREFESDLLGADGESRCGVGQMASELRPSPSSPT
jgi:chromosome segregation and condensation protein ScpB